MQISRHFATLSTINKLRETREFFALNVSPRFVRFTKNIIPYQISVSDLSELRLVDV